MFQHRHEPADAPRGQGVNRSGGNAIYPNLFRPEIVGEITGTGFETRFGHAHHVVMRNNFLSAVIGHRHNASAICHHRRHSPRQRDERIGADVVRGPKRLACRTHKIAFERFLGRERDGMQHKIDTVGFAANFFKKRRDFFVAGNIARKQRGLFAKFTHEFLDVFLQPLALIIENQFCASIRPRFRDCPGDAAFVRHAKNDADFTGQDL